MILVVNTKDGPRTVPTSWVQPLCRLCWAERRLDREPVTSPRTTAAWCYFCGAATLSGIFAIVDPETQELLPE